MSVYFSDFFIFFLGEGGGGGGGYLKALSQQLSIENEWVF